MESCSASRWSVPQVTDWLASLELSQYSPKFEELRIDGVLLLQVTDSDLQSDLCIQVRLHRFKILEGIRKLSEDPILSPPAQTDPEIEWSSILLKAVEGQSKNKSFEIGPEGATIGRHSGSNDYIINESFVSRKHCEVRFNPQSNQFLLKDIGSTTGTFIMLKHKTKLKAGLLFQMGLSEFKVSNIRFTPYGVPVALTLLGYEGPARGREVFVDKHGAVIGRDSEHLVSISEDSQLSSKHGRVFWESSSFYVEDLGSTNKTWMRISEEAEASAEFSIHIDDIIKIGSTVLQVAINEEVCNKENVSEETACKICFTAEPNTLCYPCGHLFCLSCLRKCKQCPVCRQEITDKVKVYK